MSTATLDHIQEYTAVLDNQASRSRPDRGEVELFVQCASGIFDLLASYADSVQQAIAKGEVRYSKDISEAFSTRYKELLIPCARIADVLRQLEGKGVVIRGAGRFRAWMRRVQDNQIDTDVVLKAIAEIEAGRRLTLREAMDELQDLPSPRCVV